MNPFVRSLGYLVGVAYWIYISVPRFDVERRRSLRYRKALAMTRNIWVGSCCIMLVLIEVLPVGGIPLSLALSMLTAFTCYMILDGVE